MAIFNRGINPLQSFSQTSLQQGLLLGLTGLFLALSLTISAIAFCYPLEIETRESAAWLHVLTLKQGMSPYDHNHVAFIETHKGPIDALLKYFAASIFPFLESWQVIRWPVFVLPYAFLYVAWKMVCQPSQRFWAQALYLGSLGYLLLVVSAKEFLFVGRPDATVALLFVMLAFLTTQSLPKARVRAGLYGVLWGVAGMSIFLTNWRVAPSIFAVWLFSLWKSRKLDQAPARSVVVYLVASAFAAVGLWIGLWIALFDADLTLYWKHIFGFYSPASGWGTSDSGRGSAIAFFLSLWNPHADPSSLKGGPLLLSLIVYSLMPQRHTPINRVWLLLSGAVFVSNAVPYYLNYNGGGAWYFIPFVILLWFWLMTQYSRLNKTKLLALGMVLLVLLGINVQSVLLPTVKRLTTMNEAGQFLAQVRSLQQTHLMRSEDTFLFRTTYQGDQIDSGDEVEAVYETGYYGPAFNQIVTRHFERLETNPPDYIVTGLTHSDRLGTILEKRYRLIATGPGNFTANAGESLRLFQRQDLQQERMP